MKLLLVFPRFKYVSGQPPLGIASLYSYLNEKSPDLDIVVFDGTFAKNRTGSFRDVLANNRFDAVCFSLMSTMASDFHRLAAMTRQRLPEAKIIVGGPQPTVEPEYFIKRGLADIAVVGEGEMTLRELAENRLDPAGIKGTVYRKGDEVVRETERDKIADLDGLPIAAREIFDMDSYKRAWNSMDAVGHNLRGTSLIVSRGCPYQCSFCQPTLKKLFGNKIRKFSAQRILTELKYLKEKFDLNAFMFEDDTMLMDKIWTNEICDLIIKSNINVYWCCNVRADLCDADILNKMYKAGLRKINMGIESVSQRMLDDVLNKRITTKQVEDAVAIAKEIGLYVQGYFMLGHCSEKKEEIEGTIKFARRLNIDEASFSITTPLPGTFLFDKDKGSIETDHNGYDYYRDCVYKPEALCVSSRMIKIYKKIAYLYFYIRPRRLVRQVKNLFSKNGFRKFIYKLERV